MTKLMLPAAALAVALLSGCSSTPATPAATAPQGTNAPVTSTSTTSTSTTTSAPATTSTSSAPATTTTSSAPASAAAPAQEEGTAPFGGTYTWDDGISVTIGKPTTYKPSEYAATGDKFKNFLVMDVKIVNKSGKPFDPSLLYATMQSANQEADRIFDSQKLPPEPRTKLLTGREATFKMAFAVADPKDLVLEVRPDFEHESVLFKG